MTRCSPSLRSRFAIALAALLLSACQPASTMGIQASTVDTGKYFDDPRLAEFADRVQRGDLAWVQQALRAGIDPNAAGKQGFTPIFFIFPASNADVARALLRAGANPNAKLPDGTPVLQFAVRLGNPDFTKALLEFKADPNAIGANEKPVIHEAVHASASQNIQALVKAGANINVVWGGGTPLLNSVDGGSWSVAATLLDLGADTTYRSPGGKWEYTADESFCDSIVDFQPTPTNRKPILDLFAAFARRGVKLGCSAEAERFK